MSEAVSFKNVSKKYSGTLDEALDNISIAIEAGEFITIVGASGSGKTTLLKTINRLTDIDSGSIYIKGKNIADYDPVVLRLGIGYIIQQGGLLPHMTVSNNIAVVPKLLKWEKAMTGKKVRDILELVDLDYDEYKDRYPGQLSGGQAQRIALARALIADPEILLLDEPFGALDAIVRFQLQEKLKKINSMDKKTYIFVTHDIDEAFSLGDRVVVMNEGRIECFDKPDAIRNNNSNKYISELLATEKMKKM